MCLINLIKIIFLNKDRYLNIMTEIYNLLPDLSIKVVSLLFVRS